MKICSSKTCKFANLPQNDNKFGKDRHRKDGLYPLCKECKKAYANDHRKGWQSTDKEYKRQYDKAYNKKYNTQAQNKKLKYLYKITLEDKQKMYHKQDGKCAICKKSMPFDGKSCHVDHNHECGIFRGLLCQLCNQAIGLLKEDVEIILNAARYLLEKEKDDDSNCQN